LLPRRRAGERRHLTEGLGNRLPGPWLLGGL
jgi:hypothetical protein